MVNSSSHGIQLKNWIPCERKKTSVIFTENNCFSYFLAKTTDHFFVVPAAKKQKSKKINGQKINATHCIFYHCSNTANKTKNNTKIIKKVNIKNISIYFIIIYIDKKEKSMPFFVFVVVVVVLK